MASVAVENPPDLNQKTENLSNGENTNDEKEYSGKIVQITNVSPGTTIQQIATLFGFLGTVTDIRMYPSDESQQVAVKLCYIKYETSEQCCIAQHLTNTVFIDKALIVVPIKREDIPEEYECAQLLKSINSFAGMPINIPLPPNFDEEKNNGIPKLPSPPIITSSVDAMEIDEIRRTIFVRNIEQLITSEQLMAFFSGAGEIKYLRLVNKDGQKYAFVEFSAVESVSTAMQYNGVIFGGKSLDVDYAKNPIVKPESEQIASGRTPVRKMRDVDVRNPLFDLRRTTSRSPSRKRSRSRDRRSSRRSRSRSRSRKRRSRSRSRSRHRRRSNSRSPKRRSRSRSGSRSRRRRRSRSRSRSRSPRRRRSRSRSKDRRRRRRSGSKSTSRSPSRRKSKKKSRSRSRSPSRRRSRRSRSRSADRSSSSRKKKRDRDRDRDKDKKDKKDKDKEKDKEKENDPDETEKELQSLLTKISTYEQEQEREKKEKEKEKKSSSDESTKKRKKVDED